MSSAKEKVQGEAGTDDRVQGVRRFNSLLSERKDVTAIISYKSEGA